jgi:glycosyltransferase involved in cell wall biosynthesis
VSNRPRKILLVINHLYPAGGAENQLVHLARGLVTLGHEVTLCCIDGYSMDLQSLTDAGIEVVSLQASTRLGRIAAIPRLARLVRRAEVVQCTMWDASLWGRIGAILSRRPVIIADHATDRSVQVAANGASRASWIALHNRLLDRFTFATVICAASQREVLIGEGVSSEKIVHIPNGVPVEEIARAAAGGVTRDELGLPAKAPVAMQVGVFRAEKNQLGALEAFVRVRERVGDARLVFVGKGLLQADVERRAKELGATEWVLFLGNRSDVPALLSLADLMLLPSTSDAMPMTVLEAMAIGVPVLATDVGDIARVLEGRAGVCVPAGDLGALADACVELLANDAERKEMGDAGAKIAPRFDSSKMAERYSLLFDAACNHTPPLAAISTPTAAGR